MITLNKDFKCHKINIEILKKQLEIYKKAKSIMLSNAREIKKLIEKYDGKIYSKRFLNALQKIDSHFYINKDLGYCYLSLNFFNERSIFIDDRDSNILGSYYATGEIYLLTFHSGYIPSSNINSQLLQCYEYILNEIDKLNYTVDNYYQLLDEYNAIVKSYNDFYSKTDKYFLKLNNIKFS